MKMGHKGQQVAWNKGLKGELSHSFGHVVSEDAKQKIGNANRGEKNGMFGKPSPMKGRHQTEEAKQKNRLSHLGTKQNLSEETKKKKRELALQNLPKMQASDKHYDSSERNRKISEAKKLKWQDIEWKEAVLKKVFESNKIKPNKLELSFQKFLDEHFPNDWKYVGDGTIWIAGKCPDFWNMNGKKQIIELFGSYFHKPEDEQVRKDHFAHYGYKTLVVWESELRAMDTLKLKLTNFMEEK